jgi:2-isopropylmalate synthase
MNANRRIRILDTTLRDGDQAAGFAFTSRQKIDIARLLVKTGVDCIETGFPSSSRKDFETCCLLSAEIREVSVAVFTRAVLADIRRSAEALGGAASGVLHLSLPVSRLHIETKLGKTEKEVLQLATECTRYASGLAALVEAGAEDATRADREFLLDYCGAVTEAGARIVNIADTVGCAVPGEFSALVGFLTENVPAFADGRSILSVHCHNDLGLALANTLAGITAGCGQIETTSMGIGERNGNVALEEIAYVLEERKDFYPGRTNLIPLAIGELAKQISGIIGTDLSPFKPGTGRNSDAHASGLHQQGLHRNRKTYGRAGGTLFGIARERIIISRHSGKAGLLAAIQKYAGTEIEEGTLAGILEAVKDSSDAEPMLGVSELLSILWKFAVIPVPPARCISLEIGEKQNGNKIRHFATATFMKPGKPLETYTSEEDSWTKNLTSLIKPLLATEILALTISFSGYGQGETVKRLYLEATVMNQPPRKYALERTGRDLSRLRLECLLDIVNAENTLTRPR